MKLRLESMEILQRQLDLFLNQVDIRLFQIKVETEMSHGLFHGNII